MTAKKIEIDGPFTFTENHCGWDVSIAEKDRNKDLGSLRYSERTKKWSFGNFANHDDQLNTPGLYPIFETRLQAAQALFLCRDVIAHNPLSDAARLWFTEKAQQLRERRTALRSEIFAIQREMWTFQKIAKENQLEFDFYVETKKEVQDLSEFMKENMDGFYEDLGKGTARTLRSLMRSVVMLIDPETAELMV